MNLIASTAALAAAVPTTAPAIAEAAQQDEIFALIEAHRAAAKASSEAADEQCRREEILIDEGIGLCPYVVVMWGGRPVTIHTHDQIDKNTGATDRQRAGAHAELDRVLKRYREIFGDAEDVADATYKADREALDRLISTVPTSNTGLQALLSYVAEEVEDVEIALRDEGRLETLLVTIQEALAERVTA
ncbi:hypothetical protein ACE10X_22405 [Bradyrhizobium sp. Pha-3]|uniref:hypothetical protein n=1 Tax=Bradyrhizobium sp. Pha-3 TaxID=208375 RepID=UPI0035D4F3AF